VSIAEYLGYILEPGENGDTRPNKNSLNVTDSPAISATFENGSASLEIRAMYRGNPVLGRQGAISFMGGPIMISFLGTVDGNRSDALMASANDTPVWNETSGFSKGNLWRRGRGLLAAMSAIECPILRLIELIGVILILN
jgi:hypothetical protein